MLLRELRQLSEEQILLEGITPDWLKPISSKLTPAIRAIVIAATLIASNSHAATPEQLLQLATEMKKAPDAAYDPGKILQMLKKSPRFGDVPTEQLADLIDKQELLAAVKKEFAQTVADKADTPRQRNELVHVAAEEFDKMINSPAAKTASVITGILKILAAGAKGYGSQNDVNVNVQVRKETMGQHTLLEKIKYKN